MAPRFDADKLVLTLSVADLLDARLLRHLGFSQRGGFERLWVGQAIHGRYQQDRLAVDATYRREVALSRTVQHRGWEVVVRGRADGLRRDADGTLVVEEIKSVRRGGQLGTVTQQIYEQQAMLYVWMLASEEKREPRAELVLIEIGSHDVERVEVEGNLAEVDEEIRRRLNGLIRAYDKQRAAAARRRRAAARLEFPYAEMRPGQERIVGEVSAALEGRSHLLVEAPTGLGKTVAALFPALRHALEREKKIFVLTSKTLQQEMAVAVLDLLNQDGDFHALRLRAKAKMCANEELICHEEFCRFAKDYYRKLAQTGVVQRVLGEARSLVPETVYAAARAAEVCPFEVSLELTGRAQVVVCDYNYAFDPYVSLTEFGGSEDLETVLIIDEIHNLVERGRSYYSPELSAAAAAETAEWLAASAQPLHRELASLCRDLAAHVRRTVEAELTEGDPGASAAEVVLAETPLWSLRTDFDSGFVDYIELQRESSGYRADDRFVDLYFSLLRFQDGLYHATGEAFSQCVERGGGDHKLRVVCKDASRFLGAVINRTRSTIGLSATLSPPEFYRDLLGFDPERTSMLDLASPFPRANRCYVIDDSVGTAWKERAAYYRPIAERLAAFAGSVPGNCLALFPSYRFLASVAEHLAVPGKRILIQDQRATDEERQQILAALRSPLAGELLLLAVAGGVFAEGVDYPGEMLKAVAVVGPCLPTVNLERQLLRHYYQERFERGFEYAFVVPGMTRVVQAAGRLIRSAEDTGVIALLDHRFLREPYRRHIPPEWYGAASPEELIGDPGAVAADFFLRGRGADPP